MLAILTIAGLLLPLVLALVAYDLRWVYLSTRARRLPPWGAIARLFAALCCHGGAVLLIRNHEVWNEAQMRFWMHMTFDPGLTFYALGLWDLYSRLQKRGAVG